MSAWAAGPPKIPAVLDGDAAIGSTIRMTLVTGEEVSGEVFTSDKAADVIVLKTAGSKPDQHGLRMISLKAVKDILERTPPPAGYQMEKLPDVLEDRLARREQEAVKAAEVEAERIGQGVTREAQALFDAIAKTLPCRWSEKSIVVLDEVLIQEPYKPDSCTGGNATALQRVQKVLEHERKRMDGSSVY